METTQKDIDALSMGDLRYLLVPSMRAHKRTFLATPKSGLGKSTRRRDNQAEGECTELAGGGRKERMLEMGFSFD